MSDRGTLKRSVLVATVVVVAAIVGGAALAGSAVAAENLHDGSTTHPSTGETIYAANSTEKKSITYGYVVENVTNSGETVELYLQFEDPFNNTKGDDRLSSFGGNVTCLCGGNPQSVGIASSADIVDGPDGDGNQETIKIAVDPDIKDKPIDIIVNFTGDVTWTEEQTNVKYNVSGAVIEPNKDIDPPEQFEKVIVAGGLYTETAGTRSVSSSSATLAAQVWNLNGTSDANLSFTYWKKNQKASTQQTTSEITVDKAPDTYGQEVTGLDEGETYRFKSTADNGKETDEGPILEFATSGLNVDTEDPSSITDDTATLNGNLKDLAGENSVDVRFRYWEKGDKQGTYSSTDFVSKSSTGSFSETVSGLNSNTTYVFVAEVETSDGTNDFGAKLEFDTADELGVTTNGATEITDDTATLNGELTELAGEDSVDVRFRYWEKGDKRGTYSSTDFVSKSSTGSFSETVSGLNSNTTYVFVAEVETSDGTNDFGAKLEFDTANELDVTTNSASGVTSDSATLNGELNGLAGEDSVDVRFRYWEKGDKQGTYSSTDFVSKSSTGSFSETVSGLNSGTTYVFVAEVETSDGTNDFGAKLEFTTS